MIPLEEAIKALKRDIDEHYRVARELEGVLEWLEDFEHNHELTEVEK